MITFIKTWLGKKAENQTFAFVHRKQIQINPNFDRIPVEAAPLEYGGENPCEIIELTSYVQTLTVEGPRHRLVEFRKSVSRRGADFSRWGGSVLPIPVPTKECDSKLILNITSKFALPKPVYVALVERNPDLNFKLEWTNFRKGTFGQMVSKNGNVHFWQRGKASQNKRR